MKPQIFSVKHSTELTEFQHSHSCKVADIYKNLDYELYCATHPQDFFSPPMNLQQSYDHDFQRRHPNPLETYGQWVYLPWAHLLYHLLSASDYFSLRTIRNRDLVTNTEQQCLGKAVIAIAGLSVGKNTLLSLARYGIGCTFHIAEMDAFEVSNMNRASYDLLDYHQPKIDTTIQQLWQIDPYLKVVRFADGLHENNLAQFVTGADIIVDTFDYFPIKIALRQLAKQQHIPVISGADLEKGVFITVERYDLTPDLDLSLYLNHQDIRILKKATVTKRDITNFFINMIGSDLHSPRMLESVNNVGKTLTSYPQLIVASQLFASCLTILCESILLKKPLPSNRIHIDLPHLMKIV